MRRFIIVFICFTAAACSGGNSASSTLPQADRTASGSSSGTRLLAPAGGARRPDAATSCSGSGGNSFIGGGVDNVAGAYDSGVLEGQTNVVCDIASSIGGGDYNLISSGSYAWIGAGSSNTIATAGSFSAIDAGFQNSISAALDFIGAGDGNVVSAGYSSVVGGEYNTSSATLASIGGGFTNTASGEYGTVAGGNTNTASGVAANVAGGANNVASGGHATVLGGSHNTASGSFSLAAGLHSNATMPGSFVWTDESDTTTGLTATVANQFLARAAGGFTLWTNSAATVGATLAPGSGAWASTSDRNMKTNVVALDDAEVLDRVGRLPISTWSYVTEHGVRHVGPMAQDFYAAFNVGADDRHITSIDEDGVALAAIKALRKQNADLRAQVTMMNRRFTRLEGLVDRMQRTP